MLEIDYLCDKCRSSLSGSQWAGLDVGWRLALGAEAEHSGDGEWITKS